jgi:hypothetical protein
MTIGTALFLALALGILCLFTFALIIYTREFNREEKLVQDAIKAQDKYYDAAAQTLQNLPVVYVDIPVKKTKATSTDLLPPTKTSKKNVN